MEVIMRERIIGQADQIQELTRIAKVWQNPTKYESTFGQKVPHVILLVGAAGTGKTTIAGVFIQETGLQTVRPNESEFPQDFQGWIKHTVATAMSIAAPNIMGAVALIEDLDRKLPLVKDSAMGSPIDVFEFEMGVPKEHGLVLITARSETPLKSLIDKGIFDRIVRLKKPTVRENEYIFKQYLENKPCIAIDCAVIASLLVDKTVTDLEKALQIASEMGYEKGKDKITMDELVDACLSLVYNAKALTSKDKIRRNQFAFHEAGHAVVSEVLRPGSVAVASIKTCHSGNVGITCETYPDERWETDFDQKASIRMILAGKAASQVMCREKASDSSADIGFVKKWVRNRLERHEENAFVDLYGRSKDVGGTGTLSDDFDRKTRTILAKEYGEIVKFFSYDCVKECLDAVARALIERKTLLGDEVRAIMAEHPIAETCIVMFQIEQ